MEHTPQSLRSSLSPYQHSGRRQAFQYHPSYPTPPQTGSTSLQPTPNPGLGLYACSMLSPSAQSGARGLPPSPQPSELWTHASVVDKDMPGTSQSTDIFDEYDPFSTIHSTSASAYPPTAFTSAPYDAHSLTQSPGRSSHNRHSHRSSISSSCAPSDIYSQPNSETALTSKIKMEESNEWFTSGNQNDSFLQRTSSPQVLSTVAQECMTPYSRPYYFHDSSDAAWERSGRHANSSRHLTERDRNELLSSPDGHRPKSDEGQRSSSAVPRTKKKRQRTTPEDAVHVCRICGQGFRRSYNWKSHMDIHNPARKYPHPCPEADCQAKFTRKTDLDRHHGSVSTPPFECFGEGIFTDWQQVHLKKRNFRCDLCGNRFARKDTLRR